MGRREEYHHGITNGNNPPWEQPREYPTLGTTTGITHHGKEEYTHHGQEEYTTMGSRRYTPGLTLSVVHTHPG